MNLDTNVNAIPNHFASALFLALTPPPKGVVYCVTIILQRSQQTMINLSVKLNHMYLHV